jgi:hypothetical protein
MRIPFPGMDPFIEARGLWSDFHASLIVELHPSLAPDEARVAADAASRRAGE